MDEEEARLAELQQEYQDYKIWRARNGDKPGRLFMATPRQVRYGPDGREETGFTLSEIDPWLLGKELARQALKEATA